MGIFSKSKPDPVDHDTASAAVTAGSSVAKWGLLGIIAVPLLGAAIGALLLGGAFAIGSAATPVLVGATLIGGLAGGTIGTVGTMTFAAPLTGFLAAAGGLFGLIKGGSRVSKERAAYKERENNNDLAIEQKLMQQRMIGRQEGLQAADEYMSRNMPAPVNAAPAAAAVASASANCNCPVIGDETKKVVDRRNAAAAAAGAAVTAVPPPR